MSHKCCSNVRFSIAKCQKKHCRISFIFFCLVPNPFGSKYTASRQPQFDNVNMVSATFLEYFQRLNNYFTVSHTNSQQPPRCDCNWKCIINIIQHYNGQLSNKTSIGQISNLCMYSNMQNLNHISAIYVHLFPEPGSSIWLSL